MSLSQIIITAIVITTTMTITPLIGADVLAKGSGYQSGYDHGVSDANSQGHWYITQPGKGFQFHTSEFVHGYVDGFCSIRPGMSSDADEAMWDCSRGFSSAAWVTK